MGPSRHTTAGNARTTRAVRLASSAASTALGPYNGIVSNCFERNTTDELTIVSIGTDGRDGARSPAFAYGLDLRQLAWDHIRRSLTRQVSHGETRECAVLTTTISFA